MKPFFIKIYNRLEVNKEVQWVLSQFSFKASVVLISVSHSNQSSSALQSAEVICKGLTLGTLHDSSPHGVGKRPRLFVLTLTEEHILSAATKKHQSIQPNLFHRFALEHNYTALTYNILSMSIKKDFRETTVKI